MSFLDPVYYAVSAVMWVWHQAFGAVFGPSSAAAWVLAVVFLVVTLRALLVRPALAQMRSAAVLRGLAPQLAELRSRHADDPARLLTETSALQKAHGASTLRTLLPALLQIPVFLGLLHVLQGFRDPGVANYAFGPDQVSSFLDARLFGAPLSAYVSAPQQLLAAFGVERWQVVVVAVPLMLLAAVATHVTARHSATRQAPSALARWAPWVFPLGGLVGGVFFPFSIGVLVYWLTSNAWTLGQQWFGFRWTDRVVAVPVPPTAAPPVPVRPNRPARRSRRVRGRGRGRGRAAARRRPRPSPAG